MMYLTSSRVKRSSTVSSAGARQLTVATNFPSASRIARRPAAGASGPRMLLALRALDVPLLALADEGVLEGGLGPVHAPRLVQPVQRQADGHDDQEDQRPPQRAVELGRLQLLVAEVGLAVGGQLDLGADLGLPEKMLAMT